MLALLLCACFSEDEEEPEVKFSDVLVGNWTITMVDLDDDGREKESSQVYSLSVAETATPGTVAGTLFVDDEEGVPTPAGKLALVQNQDVKSRFSVQYNDDPEAESMDELASTMLTIGLDDTILSTGKTSDGSLYSLNILSPKVFEVTLYNNNTKAITLVRCLKDVDPAQKPSTLNALMPLLTLLPMFLMTWMGGANQAPAPQPAGPGSAKKEN